MEKVLSCDQVQPELVRSVLRGIDLHAIQTSNTQCYLNSGLVCGADSGDDIISINSPITLDITTSGVNGLDGGSEAPNTWYYIWAIKNPSNGNVGCLLSASNTSPILPSGYTKKRLFSAVRNDASSNFRLFKQVDDTVFYYYSHLGASWASYGAWYQFDFTSLVPPPVKKTTINGGVTAQRTQDGSSNYLYWSYEDVPANPPTPGNMVNWLRTNEPGPQAEVMLYTNADIVLSDTQRVCFWLEVPTTFLISYTAAVYVIGYKWSF